MWGGDRARPRLAGPRALMGSDPDVLYALGERDGAVVLETWGADTGVRLASVSVARGGQLRADRVWRADRDDQVVVAVRGVDRNELAILDLRTGSLWEEQRVPFALRVMASSRDARTHVEYDRESPGDAQVVSPRATLRPEMRQGSNTYAVSGDGLLVACWNDRTRRLLVFEATTLSVVASTDERFAFQAPLQMVFSDDRGALWCAAAGEVRCFALPSMTELGRWTGASRAAEIVAVDRSGRAALLDGPVAFEVGHEGAVSPRDRAWSAHLARLSPDGRRLAHASGALGWYDLAREQRVELHEGGHAGEVLSIAASRDGRRVATSSTDRSIRVCDAATGAAGWVFEGDAEGFGALAFAPDGRTLYAVTHGHAPRLTAWSLEDGVETTPSPLALDAPGRIEVSDDGARMLVVPAAAGRATAIDLARFARVAGGDADAPRSPSVEVHDDAPEEIRLVLRDAPDSARELARFESPVRLPVTAAAVGARRVALAGAEGQLAVVERTLRERQWLGDALRTRVTALAFSPDESTLYAGTENGQVRVYRVADRAE